MGSKLLLRLIPRSTRYCASPGGYGFHKRRQERYNTRWWNNNQECVIIYTNWFHRRVFFFQGHMRREQEMMKTVWKRNEKCHLHPQSLTGLEISQSIQDHQKYLSVPEWNLLSCLKPTIFRFQVVYQIVLYPWRHPGPWHRSTRQICLNSIFLCFFTNCCLDLLGQFDSFQSYLVFTSLVSTGPDL